MKRGQTPKSSAFGSRGGPPPKPLGKAYEDALAISEGWDTVAFPSGGRWILRSCAKQKTDEVCCKAVEEVYTKELARLSLVTSVVTSSCFSAGHLIRHLRRHLPPLGKANRYPAFWVAITSSVTLRRGFGGVPGEIPRDARPPMVGFDSQNTALWCFTRSE